MPVDPPASHREPRSNRLPGDEWLVLLVVVLVPDSIASRQALEVFDGGRLAAHTPVAHAREISERMKQGAQL